MTFFMIAALIIGAISWFARISQQHVHTHHSRQRPEGVVKKWYENQNQVTKTTLRRFV